MKLLSHYRVNALLLAGTLIYCGVRLRSSVSVVSSDQKAGRVGLATEQSLPFTAANGVDVFGRVVLSAVPTKDKPLTVFLLRGDRVDQDLSFWKSVSALTSKAKITLVGYCDGLSCSDGVRRFPQELPFQVIEYGEGISAQSLVNSDQDGYLLKLVGRKERPKKIKWREANSTPFNISLELDSNEN